MDSKIKLTLIYFICFTLILNVKTENVQENNSKDSKHGKCNYQKKINIDMNIHTVLIWNYFKYFSVFPLFSIVSFKNAGCASQSGTVASSGYIF